jgi:hypothetical protein
MRGAEACGGEEATSHSAGEAWSRSAGEVCSCGDANPRAGMPWAGESGPDDEADSTSKLEAEAGSIDIDGPVATW